MSITTLKIPVVYMSNPDLVETKSEAFTYAYQNMCNNIELSSDKGYIAWFRKRYKLSDMECRSVISKSKAQMSALQTAYEKKQKKLEELEEDLSNAETKRKRCKINKKIIKVKRSLKKGFSSLTFGGKTRQRALTKECNKENPDPERILKLKTELAEARKMPLYVIGEANRHGNRFFELRCLSEGKIIYKPKMGEKCIVNMKLGSKQQRETLLLIENAVRNKTLSCSCGLDQKYFYLTFDTEELHGYAVNEKERKKAVAEIKKHKLNKDTEKQEIKKIHKAFYDEQRARMLIGKLSYIHAAIDLNPTGIGFTVSKFFNDGSQKILEAIYYDFRELCKKTKSASDSDEQRYQNNKRTYETALVYKDIFQKCKHHKVSVFSMEDLDMDLSEDMGEKDRTEFRRLVNNIWNRSFQTQIIERRCAEIGIELRKVNPVYSSFIGNALWNFSDAVNAASEICRRGYYLYTKNCDQYPFPDVTEDVVDTLENRFDIKIKSAHVAQSDESQAHNAGNGSVCSTSHLTWKSLFQLSLKSCKDYRDFRNRGRAAPDSLPQGSYSVCRHKSVKSLVNMYIFNIKH